MQEYPREFINIKINDTEYLVKELTLGYIYSTLKDNDFDVPKNALLCSNFTIEQINNLDILSQNELYKQIIDITFTNQKEETKSKSNKQKDKSKTLKEYSIAIAKMIRNGHPKCMDYGVSFFQICLDEIAIYERDLIKINAYASRIAKVEDFAKAIKDIDKTEDNKPQNVDINDTISKLKGFFG